ncbi:MAG: beta-propeller repeat protein [Solirubrobacteraceae bacterium]|nr:beta-propeller repeat protein [Solirubrobacteraceae bacterium]
MKRPALLLALLAVLVAVPVVLAVNSVTSGRIGPGRHLLDNGRRLHPLGRQVRLGQFPTGGAVTPNGRWYWTVSAGRGQNDVRIVDVRHPRVRQTLVLPGASGGIVMDPAHAIAYVSGVAESSFKSQATPADVPGKGGNVVHVFTYSPKTGVAQRAGVIEVPPPSDAPAVQAFPPTPTTKDSWPDRLAVARDGSKLLVPLNLADAAAIVDVKTKKVSYVNTGSYPYGAAILRDGKTGLVSNESPGTVSVIDLASATKVKDITVGPHLSHPEAIALDPKGDKAYVALANSDQVAVIDTKKLTLSATIAVGRPEGLGTSPVALTVTPDGKRLLVALAGTDQIAVVALPRKGNKYPTVASLPTAQYPDDVQVTRGRPQRLLYVSGKGQGTGPNLGGPQPNSPLDTDEGISKTQYLPLLNHGSAGIAAMPTGARLRRLTRVANAEVRPSNPEKPPLGTPLRADGPIKHVFYIVKENRTYDQILGDVARGDGDPKLALFGGDITPNAHALVNRFPLVDHLYADSEASIDGHFWTSAAKVSDYVNKAWFENYGGRDRPYDFGVYAVTWPSNGFLFDQAQRQGISYFNYGEAIAGTVPLTDKDRTSAETQEVADKFAHSDLGAAAAGNVVPAGQCYPNDASIGHDAIASAALDTNPLTKQGAEVYDTSVPPGAKPLAESRFDCFKKRFTTQLASNAVPAFNYMVMSNDHTEVLTPGARTQRAMIADNDEAVGRVVDLISHSSIWDSSAIFVIEDDSQDGPDHVDAHRIPAYVISPYARNTVLHNRYDMLSVIRSFELILGMKPLGLFDALATPMYDAFSPTIVNPAPYDYIPAKVPLVQYNPAGTPGARESSKLPHCLDCESRRTEDALLWKSIHGWRSAPPPPGPNAETAHDATDPDG